MKQILVLIDNGHGDPPLTGGKCSPDGRLKEYTYCREIAQRISRELSLKGIETKLLVPETKDIPLTERVRRVNGWCAKRGAKNVVLVSVHNNAGPETQKLIVRKDKFGTWKTATGFSVMISKNASSNSKRLAKMFTERAMNMGLMGNRAIPQEKYWVQSLAMTRDTNCPAVLTENLFQDNEDEVKYLLSEEGKQAITRLHTETLIEYIKSLG